MRHLVKKTGFLLAAVMILMLQAVMSAAASDDNSLYDLGIKTEGAEIEPAFQYDIWSYEVTVPGGTTELALEPVPSSSEASISSITGTTLDAEGNGTVYADNTEILYFAIVTETDGKQSLWFRLTDEASVKLQTQPINGDCFMTFNDEKIGTATLNDDCTIAKVFSENTAGEITAWASKIRGLA